MTQAPGAGLDRESLAHVARLAKLPLSEQESDALVNDLERILRQFSSLPEDAASQENGIADEHDQRNVLREDAVTPAPNAERARILENFTQRDGDLLKAPRGL